MRRQILFVLMDICIVLAATLSAGAIRDNFDFSSERASLLVPYLCWTALSALLVLPSMGVSRSIWRFSSLADYARIIPAVSAIVFGAVAMGFLFNRLDNVARTLPILQGILMIFTLIGARVAFRLYHARRRHKPKLLAAANVAASENVVIVGVNRIAELYMLSANEFAVDRIKVAGLLGKSDRQTGWLLQSVKVLGVPEDAVSILNELRVRGIAVDRIVVTMAFDKLSPEAQSVLLQIERDPNIKLDFFGERLLLDERRSSFDAPSAASKAEAATVLRIVRDRDVSRAEPVDASAFTIDPATLAAMSRHPYWIAKRVLDIVAAIGLLAVLWPMFLVVAALVAYDVGWPVSFWQQRPGLGGQGFRLYKFRTMAAAYDSSGKRIPDERRLSRIGAFLRRSRLDELPQLIHILASDMSFVGPRPLLPVDQSPAHAARLLVRPGMTGWAQVKGGRGISATDKAALDVWYVNNASLILDLKILLATFPIIVSGERVDEVAIRAAWLDLAANGICEPSSLPVEHRATATRS